MQKLSTADGVGRDMVVLTPRERRVIRFVSCGLANKEIAHRLNITPDTVKVYVSNLLRELGFTNRVELARWAWFHPQVFESAAVEIDLHLPGCKCSHPQCTMMLALDAASNSISCAA